MECRRKTLQRLFSRRNESVYALQKMWIPHKTLEVFIIETTKRLNEGKFVQIGVNGIGEPYSITFLEKYDDYFMKIEIL